MGLGVLFCCVAASLLFIQPIIATDDALPPSIASFADDVCDDIDCGNGTCKAHKDLTFTCECNPGWRRYYTDERFRFLPCVIPNCSLDLKCKDETAAPPPVPPPYENNLSFTDPCAWAYCGGGTCVKTSRFGYRCDCKTGFLNLYTDIRFPCLSECALGTDCKKLGVVLSNRSSASTPGLSDSGRAVNEAWRVPSTHLLWPVIFIISLAMVPWI